jgi:outer membrane protein assembly factor BamB
MVVVNKMEDGAGGVFGVDRKSGQIRWKHEWPSSAAIYSTPLLYEPQGGSPQLVTSGSTGFLSLDPKTGKLNWEVRDVFKARCVSSPVLYKGLIFGTAGNGGGDRQGAAIRPGASGAPQVAYQPTKGVGYVPTPIAYGDHLFLWGDGGIVTCLKADTGEQVWMERVGGRFFGSPVCIDGKLYAMDDRGTLVVIEAGPTFKELGRVSLGEQSHATPAVAKGVMYLRTVSHLISVGGKKN